MQSKKKPPFLWETTFSASVTKVLVLKDSFVEHYIDVSIILSCIKCIWVGLLLPAVDEKCAVLSKLVQNMALRLLLMFV